jgi:metal-sulfur cluster biosynthetic enzyme
MPLTEADVRGALKNILDPEIKMSIMDLGLIYGVDIKPLSPDENEVNVRMTLTTPACPYGPALLSQVHRDLTAMPQVSQVNVDLVWIPPWDPKTMASDEAKLQMGIFDLEEDDSKGEK